MTYSVGLVNLGCAKNQIDAEIMLARLEKAGYTVKDDASLADVAIVNTCGFIEAAKKESIDEILELARLKSEGKIRAIIVTGCLAERYKEEVMKNLPEVDAVAGIGADGNIEQVVAEALAGKGGQVFPQKTLLPLCGERKLLTPSWSAYLKIAEGCDNRCAYCAIPAIRGRYRSRPAEDIVEEARALAKNGAKELVLIAQDTTRYGIDLYGNLMLPVLLRQLCKIDGVEWIRLLYCYPDTMTDELIETIAQEEKIVNYVDLPLQHCNERVLKSMRRAGNRDSLVGLIGRMREKIPGLVLRTTLIAGFPGETEEEFDELCDFVREIRFERLGCFAYSREEGTAAAEMPEQVDEEVRTRRTELVMEAQAEIMEEQAEKMEGKTIRVLAEGFDRFADCWFGRSYADSPDVDGKVFFTAKGRKPVPGHFESVLVTGCLDGDLTGELLTEGGGRNESAE